LLIFSIRLSSCGLCRLRLQRLSDRRRQIRLSVSQGRGHRLELVCQIARVLAELPRHLGGEAADRDPGQRQPDDRVGVHGRDPVVGLAERARDLRRHGVAMDVAADDGGLLVRHLSILSG